jgi:hypothetical protein
VSGAPIPITHHGQQVTLGRKTVTLDIPPAEPPPPASQPAGRVPLTRYNHDDM